MNREAKEYDEVKAFFEQWHIYRLIIENDYMAHRGIHAALGASLRSLYKEPFSILDVGCGDGSLLARTLHGLPVSRYIGVDLSAVALQEAEKNLAALSVPLTLVPAEFGEYLAEGGAPTVDVLLAGFALHHYQQEKKARFFVDAIAHLNPGGRLYLYDPILRPGETRDQYIEAYCEILERTWSALTPEQQKLSCEHIRDYDYPAPFETLADFAQSAGFTCPSKPLHTDPAGLYGLLCFTHDTVV